MSVILVLGKGGREHALVKELSKSKKVRKILVYPGNYGTAHEPKTTNLKWIDLQDLPTVDLVVVGPEDYLERGIADNCAKKKIPCFGPTKACTRIESSKIYAKRVMEELDIPTAKYTLKSSPSYLQFINDLPEPPVIKRDGLCGGKGVFLPESREEAKELLATKFLGENLIIEERLHGEEVSVLCFSDGKTIRVMPPIRDYKRLSNRDRGPNTGSMGSYCTPSLLTEKQKIEVQSYLQKVIDYFREKGTLYVGVLYAGIMITGEPRGLRHKSDTTKSFRSSGEGIKILEFNARYGDSEAQVVLPLSNNLFDIMIACVKGTLHRISPNNLFSNDTTVIVNVASIGYPFTSGIGYRVEIEESKDSDSWIVFASLNESGKTCGGRVLGCVGMGANLFIARRKAYKRLESVSFPEMQYRTDIANEYRPIKLIVLGSTRGTDLRFIYERIEKERLNAEVVAVGSDREDAGILEKAKDYNTPFYVFSNSYPDFVEQYEFDLIVLIGYMKIVPKDFVQKYENRIINVHPSLLPAFAGGIDRNVHRAVLDSGVKISGCTVHIVTEDIDGGRILIQKSCIVDDNETVDTLKSKVQELEGYALCEAIEMYPYDTSKKVRKVRKYSIDIDTGNRAVQAIRKGVESTYTENVKSSWGSFAGCYKLNNGPLLVSSTDSVGSKILLSRKYGKLDTIGIDLVHHCINDILVMGSVKPLFFLDYIGTSKLDPIEIEQIVDGVTKACKEYGLVLLGGETAEIPSMYREGSTDLVGMIVGTLNNLIDTDCVKEGDIVLGIPSSGFHTNGYTLINKYATEKEVKEYDLLAPHRCYLNDLKGRFQFIHGLVHLTGGGWVDNPKRILPSNLRIEREEWDIPLCFHWIQKVADISAKEMYRTFNMGIGMLVIVGRENVNKFPNLIRVGKIILV